LNAADTKRRKDDDRKGEFSHEPVEDRLVAVIKNPLAFEHLHKDNKDKKNCYGF
jgi:hypothetical protein